MNSEIQTAVAVIALVLSVFSIYKTLKNENTTRKTGLLVGRISCLRTMVGEIESVSSENLVSLEMSTHQKVLIVAKKAEEYEPIFNTRYDCLSEEGSLKIKQKIEEKNKLSSVVLDKIKTKDMDQAPQDYLDYVKAITAIVVSMEEIPKEEMKKASLELRKLMQN